MLLMPKPQKEVKVALDQRERNMECKESVEQYLKRVLKLPNEYEVIIDDMVNTAREVQAGIIFKVGYDLAVDPRHKILGMLETMLTENSIYKHKVDELKQEINKKDQAIDARDCTIRELDKYKTFYNLYKDLKNPSK